MAKATKVNPHTGSSFDDFLKEDGIYEEVQARALKRALAEQLDDETMRQLNAKVDVEHQSPSKVAATYLRQHPPAEEQP